MMNTTTSIIIYIIFNNLKKLFLLLKSKNNIIKDGRTSISIHIQMKNIEVGIVNEEYVEITAGLNEGSR